jgi:hypothetical protein
MSGNSRRPTNQIRLRPKHGENHAVAFGSRLKPAIDSPPTSPAGN